MDKKELNLAAEAAALSAEVQALRGEVTNVDDRRKKNVLIGSILGLVLFLCVIAVGWTSYQVYDCTVAGGNCYQRNMENQGRAIQELQYIILFSNECSVTHYNDTPKIQPCVEEKLEALHK